MKRRRLLKRLRDQGENLLVDGFALLCRVLPVGPSVRAGAALGGLVARCDRRRRRVALANLELAYRDALTPAQREALVVAVYRHLGRFLFEYLLLLMRPDLRPLSRFIAIDGLDATRAAIAEHGAAIFVTLHQGHWELLGGAFSKAVTPLHTVMKPIRNPLLNERVVRMRSDLGMVLIRRRSAVPVLFRCLRRNQSVAMLCDLDHRARPLFTEFFGVPAATVRTPGLLAARTGKPVIVGSSWGTERPLVYRATLNPPIRPRPGADPQAEAERVVGEMTRQIEQFVRAHPEQWHWIHPRWRTRPTSESSFLLERREAWGECAG